MVAIPNETGDHYTTVKKCLSVEHAIPSQVITGKKILSKVGIDSSRSLSKCCQ